MIIADLLSSHSAEANSVKRMILIALLIPVAGNATPILDQASTRTSSIAGLCGYTTPGERGCDWQQQVTAGISGQLTAIDLLIGFEGSTPQGSFELSFWNSGNTFNTAASDYSKTFNVVQGGFATYDVSDLGIFVTAGQTFLFSQRSLEPLTALLRAYVGPSALSDPYAGGTLGLKFNDNVITNNYVGPDRPYDLAFRTYVDPMITESVPEPGTLGLLGIGLAGLGLVRSRRKA